MRVHLPLKQGLRLNHTIDNLVECRVRVHLPLKQGLRQVRLDGFSKKCPGVRVHLPLKQGVLRDLV